MPEGNTFFRVNGKLHEETRSRRPIRTTHSLLEGAAFNRSNERSPGCSWSKKDYKPIMPIEVNSPSKRTGKGGKTTFRNGSSEAAGQRMSQEG